MTRAPEAARRWAPWILLLAGALVYANSLTGAFVFDDEPNIVDNRLLRVWPPWRILFASQRPIVELSFAVNYALGGLDTTGYHLVNVAVHLLAGLTLFGILRRTLSSTRLAQRYGDRAASLAFVCALLWLVHPLQTQSVTYIVQRHESLMGLFYLATLYAVIRLAEGRHGFLWGLAAVTFCSLGMATKQVMVTAPVVVLLYDRTFLAGSFAAALKRRPILYLGLAASWGVLLAVMDGRLWNPDTAGFEERDALSSWEYALSQPGVLLHYLRLCVWPHPLVLDYAWPVAREPLAIVPPTIVVVGLFVASVWALFRRPALGFLGAWFFLVLSITSSILPIADLAFEHRMYLPLAAVVVALVLGASELATRLLGTGATRSLRILCVLVTLTLAATTVRRNADYASAASIWRTVTTAAPHSHRAHINLGIELAKEGRRAEAQGAFERALAIEPDSVRANVNLAAVLMEAGRFAEAAARLENVLAVEPDDARAHANLGIVLYREGDLAGAASHLRRALALEPAYAEAHNNLGVVLQRQGQLEEAAAAFERARELDPHHPEAEANLRRVRARLERRSRR